VHDPVIKAAVDQVCCDLHGETVILSLKTGKYHGLDAVGARIWDLIQEPKTLHDLLEILFSEFDVEPTRCEQDVRLLLLNMTEAGLVEIGA
jgi:Coenzyme PQQ synthesis protein D (PqqD)